MNRRIAQLVVMLLFAVFIAASGYANEAPILRVTFLDVHQGDCILIRSAEKTVLIDAGDDNRNAAAKYIIPYLKKEGIKHIDQAIITHPHRDHFGGFVELIHEFSFGEFVYSNDSEISSEGETTKGPSAGAIYGRLRDLILAKKIPYRKAQLGELLNWGKGIKAEVLYCDTRRDEPAGPPTEDLKTNPNELSVVIKATVGEISYLFSGDAEKNAETDMVALHGKKMQSTVLKSGHHGSKSSSIHAFMDVVLPKYGIISVGKGNSFGHPNQSVLDIYDYHKMNVFRTDVDGNIESHTNGKTITFVTKNSPLEFTRNPEVISLTANSATIQWESNRTGATSVFYGISTLDKSKSFEHAAKVHTVTLTGLKPSTTYSFKAITKDLREPEKFIAFDGTLTTPAGSGEPQPKIDSIATNFDKIYMKHPFKVIIPVSNPADNASKDLTLEVYHSAMDPSNLIETVKFSSIPAKGSAEAVIPTKIDWLGHVEIIAILRQGRNIIDTSSANIEVNAKLVFVDAAHGNKDYFTGRFAGMNMDLFQSLGMQMRSVAKPFTLDTLKDAFVLIIPHPTLDFKKEELAAIKKYVAGGGSLLLYGQSDFKNLSYPDMLNSVLKAAGSKMRFNDDQACDPVDNIGPPWRMFVKTFPNPAISGLDVKKLLIRSSCTLVNAQMKGLASSKNLFLLATGDDDSYNTETDELADGYIYASHTPLLPIPIAAVEDLGLGRVGCVGEGLYADNFYSSPGDLHTVAFNRNMISWLSLGREKTIKELVQYVDELTDESDPEVRAERYESLSRTIIKGIRKEVDTNRSVLPEFNNMLKEYNSDTVDNLRLQVDQIYRFDSLHDN